MNDHICDITLFTIGPFPTSPSPRGKKFVHDGGGLLGKVDRIPNPNPYSATTDTSDYAYLLTNVPGHPSVGSSGLGIALKVMRDDTLNIFGKSYYDQSKTGLLLLTEPGRKKDL